ncbi:MAG TPA: DUF1501 domain-containing protein [Planctomycetota bacterium]|nr:DUF1501 domain-containing protein [Planctomycetota bacterium]
MSNAEIGPKGCGQFCGRTRREFLWEMGAGFAGLALSSLLEEDGFFTRHAAAEAAKPAGPLSARAPHLPSRAKSCIFLYMYGGPSQMDLFDYKPELQRRDGQTVKIEIRRGSFQEQKLLASRRKFERHGQSGLWCSDALPLISRQVDRLAVLKSLYADSFAHGSANLQMNSGRIVQGHPSLGSWIGYGLGTVNQNLPAFVVMLDPRGGPISGAANWSSGYMPAVHQGTVFRSTGEPILHLASPLNTTRARERSQIDAINALNEEHLALRPGSSELEARIASYELAFQLQAEAPEALDLSGETERTLEEYGVRDPRGEHRLSVGPAPFARQCLIARRLVERGVRFVQIYHGGGHQQQNWDAHYGVEENLMIHCPEIDKPISALLDDLARRGLLEDTLVVWGGEFGRQPVSQGEQGGRDHNPKGFTYFLAGGGVKGGTSYGETDDLGHEAVVDRHHIRDLHATILHLLGLRQDRLTYFYGGLDQKLTGPQGADVIRGILA